MSELILFESARPTHAERQLSECCRQLYAGAARRRLQEDAWPCIAAMFGAVSVSLHSGTQGLGELGAGPLPSAFDRSVGHPVLMQALMEANAQEGLCTFIRDGAAGADVLLVLRSSAPFTEGERCRMELLAGHVRMALELAQQFERAAEAAAAQPTIVPACQPLTKAELEVLASLLRGQTAKVIARTRGASLNTVRSQITAILAKTGRHTQKELIAAFGNM